MRAEHETDQPALAFVPQPAAQFLVRQVVLMLEPKADEIERRAQHFRDDRKHQHVQKDREEVVLARAQIRPVAQFARPAGDQQHHQQREADHHVRHAQPALEAVIAAHLRRISRLRIGNCCHPLRVRRTRRQVAQSFSVLDSSMPEMAREPEAQLLRSGFRPMR